MEDHAVTALDRPAIDLEQARRDRDAAAAPAASPRTTPVGMIVGGLILILVLLGVCAGAVLAVLAE